MKQHQIIEVVKTQAGETEMVVSGAGKNKGMLDTLHGRTAAYRIAREIRQSGTKCRVAPFGE